MIRSSAFLLLAAASLLVGCGQDMDDLEDYAREVKARKSRAIDPFPQPKAYEPFLYDPGERRDPFLPLLAARDAAALASASAGTGGIKPDLNRPREPLEEFPLDSVRMVGTITQKKQAFALIKAPDNVVHRVTVGDHIGQNFGKITAISETEVVLMEIIPDGLGAWMQRPATVALVQ